MDFDELLCTLCFNQFDKDEHLPLMIPKCGHTFCTKCLQDILQKLSSDKDFTCPEDQTVMKLNNRDVSEFPQNLALLRLLDKRTIFVNLEKQSDSVSREGRSVFKGNKSNSDKSPSSTQDFPSPVGSPVCKEKSGSSIRSSFNQQDMFYFLHADTNICREHLRKLEVVCLEHRCRICANCALFGAHKNHDIKPEEEVLREIAARAERLIDVFQAMEKSQNTMIEHENTEKVGEKIKRKCDEVVRVVRQKCNDYVSAIRTRERKVISEIGERFSKLEESFKAFKQLPQELNEKINKWKTRTHESLVSVTEKSERGEISFDLLEDRNNPKNDLLAAGEKLILDLERTNEFSSRMLESHLRKVSVVFDNNFTKSLENLCIVEIPEPSLYINHEVHTGNHNSIRPDDHKAGLPLGDIMNRSPIKKISREETNSRNLPMVRNSHLVEAGREDRQSKSKSPMKRMIPKIEKVPIHDEEGYASHIKLESLNDRINSAVENRYEDDNNLLNFEWKELNTGCNITDSSPNLIKEVPVRQSSQHHRQYSEDAGSFNRENSRDGTRYGDVNISGRLSVTKDENQSSRGDKLTLSGKKTNTRPTSPWKKGDQGTKPPRSKKRSIIKVADKFEAAIEGIEQNSSDTADLTGADLGDQGVMSLVEHLKENTTLKSLKLLKNKITDEGGVMLANLLYYNKTLHTLNLTQNQLTEKTLDAFIEAIKALKTVKLKSLYFSQNSMSLRNVKPKLKELAEMGVNAIL